MYTVCICALCIRETEYVSHHSPFALRNVHTCICALCIQETEYVSHHSPFALRNVHTGICALCTQETEYFSHNSPFALQKVLTCICALCIQETEYVSHNSPFLFCKKYLHVFVHYVIRKQNMSATTAPSALQKGPTCLWALGISHHRPLCTTKSTHLYNFTDQDNINRTCYP